MTNPSPTPSYFVMAAKNPERMLLYDLPEPGPRDSWTFGRKFLSPVSLPVVATIREEYEQALLLPYFDAPELMSDEFHETLVRAGVDNLDVYEAVIRSEDGSIEHKGYKAFNVLGVVRAADVAASQFAPGHENRLIDASILSLVLDESKVRGLLMFRLAENTGALMVHRRVKEAIEAAGFHSVVFREPSDFISL